jgi:hypothetical protein
VYGPLDSTEQIWLSVPGTTPRQPDLLPIFQDWSSQVMLTLLDLW